MTKSGILRCSPRSSGRRRTLALWTSSLAMALAGHAIGASQMNSPAPNATTVPFALGAVTLHIPREQWEVAASGGGLGGSSITLEYLLPDFVPHTRENGPSFKNPGWGSTIKIFLEYPPNIKTSEEIISDSLRPRNSINGKDYPVLTHENVYGFKFYKLSVGPTFLLSRNRPSFYLDAWGLDGSPFPYLQNRRVVLGSVYMKYTYSFDFLPHAIEIDDHVVKLLTLLAQPSAVNK